MEKECECYEEEVQPYRKTDYKPIIYRSLRAESQVFALLMLFLFVILHTMSSAKSLKLLCIFPFGMLCLSAISMMLVKILLAVCILVDMGV